MRLLRLSIRRIFDLAESGLGKMFPPEWNPLLNLGALGFFIYWVVTVSGIYLFIFFETAVLDAFASVDLDQRLSELYTSLVENTTSRIVLMQYHLAIPSSALAYSSSQLEMMTELLNGIIADEAGQVSASRITVISPPRFDIGIDMSPQYPSNFSCSYLGYKVDGPSVQSTLTQDELLVNHPLSFCSGPAVGPPWIISGDTGIHPSAAGYMHMAGQVPAPGS